MDLMTIPRRELLKELSGMAAYVALARFGSPTGQTQMTSATLPRKQDFDLTDGLFSKRRVHASHSATRG